LSDSVSTVSSQFSEYGAGVKRQSDNQQEAARSTKIKIEPASQTSNGVDMCKICNGTSNIKLISCTTCGLSVHFECYPGIRRDYNWCCDWCIYQAKSTVSEDPNCFACSKRHSDTICFKPTIGNHWIHFMCFMYFDALTLTTNGRITGFSDISEIPQLCSVCPLNTGLTIQCTTCSKVAHIPCAQVYNYWFGFELQSDVHTLKPVVLCAEHKETKPKAYLELSDVEPDSGQSWLAHFITSQKMKPLSSTVEPSNLLFALGPLARAMSTPLVGNTAWDCTPVAPTPCYECQSTFSSFWWDIFPDAKASAEEGLTSGLEISLQRSGHQHRVCHFCYWKMQEKMGTIVSPEDTSDMSP